MRHFTFVALCTIIVAVAVSAPLGGLTFIPILGLAFVAAFMLPPPKPVRPFDREWDD